MKKKRILFLMFFIIWLFGAQVCAKTILPTDVSQASQGCILLGIEGKYVVQIQEALDRVNAIRLEACEEGLINPSTGEKLTVSDYVPIRWSSDLEYIARIRAAEASLTMAHKRTNGDSWLELTSPRGICSSGEVLAWNSGSSMLMGIEQWYQEKADWKKQNQYAVTGHYTSMIDPQNLYVGLATFCTDAGSFYNTTAGEFSWRSGLDETRGTAAANCIQTLEISNSYIKSNTYTITGKNSGKRGDRSELSLTVATSLTDKGLVVLSPLTWTSSNAVVASVDANGTLTANSCGTAQITASDNSGHTGIFTYTVNHSWDDGKVTKEATLKKKGTITYTCSVCNATKKESLPKITISKGKTYIVSDMKYKITNARKDGKGTVALVGTIKSKENLSSLKVTGTIRLGGIKFKVTEIGAKAFKGYQNLKTVSVGKGISVIGKEAFSQCQNLGKVTLGSDVTKISGKAFLNCQKLQTLTIKSKKLKTVEKYAIKSISGKAVIKVPSSRLQTYKKLFKSSTGYKKTMKLKK